MRTSPHDAADPGVGASREAERDLKATDSDDLLPETLGSPEEHLEEHRLELRRGLTNMERLFLFGKPGGLNEPHFFADRGKRRNPLTPSKSRGRTIGRQKKIVDARMVAAVDSWS